MQIRTLVHSRYRSNQIHVPGLYRFRTYPKTNRVVGLYQNHLYTYTISYAYNRLMFIRDSRRSYRTYPYSELILIKDFCLFGTPVGGTKLILGFRILYGAYSRISDREIPVGIIEHFSCTKVPVGTTKQIHYTKVPVGTIGLILILSIREYPWILQRFIKYMSTRRYYRTETEVLSDLYSYSLFNVLSYVCLTT